MCVYVCNCVSVCVVFVVERERVDSQGMCGQRDHHRPATFEQQSQSLRTAESGFLFGPFLFTTVGSSCAYRVN